MKKVNQEINLDAEVNASSDQEKSGLFHEIVGSDAWSHLVLEVIEDIFVRLFSLKIAPAPKSPQELELGESLIINSRESVHAYVPIVETMLQGYMGLLMREDVCAKLLSSRYGMQIDQVRPMVNDGLCEVVNMIFGLLKANLYERGCELQMQIPVIKFEFQTLPSQTNTQVYSFSSPYGEIHVIFYLIQRESKS
jgi:CheY-specific phosphatase CheX